MPVYYYEGELLPAGSPVLINKAGLVKTIKADEKVLENLVIDRKYPTGDDNKITIGDTYDLLYWDNQWKSLGKQTATTESLIFPCVPHNALLWLHDIDQGQQERIFLYNNGKIAWY